MESTFLSIYLLVICSQLFFIAGQPPSPRFHKQLNEFDNTLEGTSHHQKVKILERLLKAIHQKSKQPNGKNLNKGSDELDLESKKNVYVDSGEPTEVGGLDDPDMQSESRRLNVEPTFENEGPETDDCVEEEEEEEALPEIPKLSLGRRPASFGSIDDFPSAARDQASKVISINNEPNIAVFDNLDTRTGLIQFKKKKRCQKKFSKADTGISGFRSLQPQQRKKAYLIIKKQ